jgi:hypothetical protein
MIDVRIKYNGVRVRLRGFGLKKIHNLKILEAGLKSVKERLARGMASDDAPTKPLTKGYAIRKSRLTRRKAIRDMRLTGKFLDNLLPRYADDHQAVAYSKGRDGRLKGQIYKDHISFSDSDQKKMAAVAEQQFRAEVNAITGQLRGEFRSNFKRDRSFFSRQSFARAS